MALLADSSADASSNLVQGVGSNTVTFTMPKNVAIKVESVVATVDNSAGGATTGKITVKDNSGQVIGTNTQGDTIPAADSGTATFALGLASTGGQIRYGRVNSGNWLDIHTTTDLSPDTGGMSFVAETGGIFFVATHAGNGEFNVSAAFVHFLLNNNIFRISDSSLTEINATTFEVITTSDWGISTNNTSVNVDVNENVNVNLANGKPLTVFDHLGNAIFRVNEDGSLQGKTGKALTFNL